MKITFENFRSVYPEVEKWLDEETKRDFKDSEGLDEFYGQDSEIKGMFDTIIAEMNAAVAKHEDENPAPKPKPASTSKPKEEKEYSVKKVDYIITDIKQMHMNKPFSFSVVKNWEEEGEENYTINDVHISKEINFNRPVTDADLQTVESFIDDKSKGGSYAFDEQERNEIERKYGKKYRYIPFCAIDVDCIAVLENGKPAFIIDAEGYGYARYIHVADGNSKVEKGKNLKWYKDHFTEIKMDLIKKDLDKERSKHNGFVIGDEIIYNGKKYIIKDFAPNGVVIDTFGGGVIFETVPFSKIKLASEGENPAPKTANDSFCLRYYAKSKDGWEEESDYDEFPKEYSLSEAKKEAEKICKKKAKENILYKVVVVEYDNQDKALWDFYSELYIKDKPAAPKKTTTSKYVDQLSEEVKIIARFVTLHGKTMAKANSSKDAPRIQLKAVQTAIREKRIRKTSQYAKEIMDVQCALIRMVNGSLSGALRGADEINIKDYEHLKEIATSEKVSDVASFAKSFIRIQETVGKEKEAKALLAKIEKSKETGEEVDGMKSALKRYIDGKTDKLKASERTLRGLYGICSGSGSMCGDEEVMNSIEIENKHFDVLDFRGKWAGFFGRPDLHFKFMFYGRAGNGKSTLALQLAGYLSKELGKRVLYVAKEEGFGYTLQEKINRLGVSNANLYLAADVPADLSNYDVIILDSVNTLGLTPEDLEKLPQDKAYVYVFQSTKDGQYKGEQAYGHNVDAIVKVEKMVATKDKNRFGGDILEFKVL